jgi:ATP-dependent DNA helicase RecQ
VLRHFGEAHPGDCGGCDNCLTPAATWDGTEAAIKVLAAIYRTGQRFGAGHIADVLVGRETEKVLSNGHHTQPVFGKGGELDAKGWQSVIRQLTAMGLIHVDTSGFGALHLTEAARPVFRHEQAITLRKDQPKRAADMRRALSRPADLPEHAAPLFDALRAERSRLAKKQGVPPYVIFHDTTLRAMAMAKPRDLEEMVDLPGIGAAKLSRYGKAFLEIIRAAV